MQQLGAVLDVQQVLGAGLQVDRQAAGGDGRGVGHRQGGRVVGPPELVVERSTEQLGSQPSGMCTRSRFGTWSQENAASTVGSTATTARKRPGCLKARRRAPRAPTEMPPIRRGPSVPRSRPARRGRTRRAGTSPTARSRPGDRGTTTTRRSGWPPPSPAGSDRPSTRRTGPCRTRGTGGSPRPRATTAAAGPRWSTPRSRSGSSTRPDRGRASSPARRGAARCAHVAPVPDLRHGVEYSRSNTTLGQLLVMFT